MLCAGEATSGSTSDSVCVLCSKTFLSSTDAATADNHDDPSASAVVDEVAVLLSFTNSRNDRSAFVFHWKKGMLGCFVVRNIIVSSSRVLESKETTNDRKQSSGRHKVDSQ